MPLLKLSCASCSAPLEIGEGLERFACSYCGTEQIVERSGGVVWLRKVEAAIKAVQSGTDRTAAELALVRLHRELEEAKENKAELIRAADAKLSRARDERKAHTLIIFAIALFVLPFIIALVNSKPNGFSVLVWLAGTFGISTLAFRSIEMPYIDTRQAVAEVDDRIAKIEKHIHLNRAILSATRA